jgi:MscS family membrane protein
LRLQEKLVLVGGRQVASFGQRIETIVNTLIVVAITMVVYAYWGLICDLLAAKAAGHRRVERLLVPMMRKFIGMLVVVCGALVCLAAVFGTQTLTGLVAGLGVTGLVVALAGKDSVENVFGSLTILFDMPFALGDYVKIGDAEGSVEEINLRSTRIRTVKDTLITLPNANLIRASVENYGARRFRRESLNVRLSYTSEPEGIDSFCQAIRDFLNAQEDVDSSQTVVQLDDPTETSVGVVIVWYVRTTSRLEESQSRSEVLAEVLKRKREKGLLLASLPVTSEQKP